MSWAPLLLPWLCLVTESGLFRGRRKKKRLLIAFLRLASTTCLASRENWRVKGLQILHLIPVLLGLKTGRRGWLPAGSLPRMSISCLMLAKMRVSWGWLEPSGESCPLLLCCSVPLVSYPQYSVFSHQWEAGRELGISRAFVLSEGFSAQQSFFCWLCLVSLSTKQNRESGC